MGIPMYVDLEPIAKSKITNPSVLVREDLLVIHLFHAGNSPVKTCAFPILVDQVPNANLEMTGLSDRPVCTCPSGYRGDPLVSCTRGECENDSECRSDQACFNFA